MVSARRAVYLAAATPKMRQCTRPTLGTREACKRFTVVTARRALQAMKDDQQWLLNTVRSAFGRIRSARDERVAQKIHIDEVAVGRVPALAPVFERNTPDAA